MIAHVVADRYRAWGADLPFADRRRAHRIAMEGYFWRFTDVASGRVVVALCGVCAPGWATVALAAHPGAFLRWADLPRAVADPARFGVEAWREDGGLSFAADASSVRVDLGDDARLDVALDDPFPARAPALGGLGPAHLLPGLGQYWDPWLLDAAVAGTARLGDGEWALDGARAYAEKNWGAGGFPSRWWWGQAQGFDRDDVTVAFAGGSLTRGLAPTAVVLRLAGERVRLGNPLLSGARTRVGDGEWAIDARGPLHSVSLRGVADPAAAHVLPVPDLAARRGVPAAHEHLAGALSLTVRRRGRVIYAGESSLAGLESGSSSRANRAAASSGAMSS